jgi:PAS domain S-box-containing protein
MTEQLRMSEKNYRELFESANEAIWVHDLEGNILIANKACERLTGYSVEELRQKNVKSFLSEESLNLAKQVREKLFQHQHVDFPYEQRLFKKDGTEAICMLTTSLIVIDGNPKAFQNIARDVTNEKKMQESLRFYLQQVTRAQEEERKRIARELHDDTAQELVALSRRLDRFISSAGDLAEKDITYLEEVRKRADSILDGVRRFSQDLRPSILDDLGLVPALEWLTSDLSRHFGIAIGTGLVGSVHRFPPETELVLFRVAQEALRNVCKHSGASRAWVTLEFGKDKVAMTIKDNGKGFELPERVGDLAKSGKLGLAGMQERVQLIGGKLTLYSKPGKGTTVTVEVSI